MIFYFCGDEGIKNQGHQAKATKKVLSEYVKNCFLSSISYKKCCALSLKAVGHTLIYDLYQLFTPPFSVHIEGIK